MTELIRCSCTRINDPWRRFCGGCGAQLAPACRCGFVNGRHDRFCGGCGHLVSRLDFPKASSPFAMPDTVRGKPRPNAALYDALTASTEESALTQAPRGTDRPTSSRSSEGSESSTIPIEILDEIQ